MVNLKEVKKVHFIGIASPFSSFCAEKLIRMGKIVTASELNQDSFNARYWVKKGILFKGGHDPRYIKSDLDLVVFPNGPVPGNPECERTKQLGLPIIDLPELVGMFSSQMKTVAVAGTHGKSTTTALISWILKEILGEVSFVLGGPDDFLLGTNQNWNFTDKNDYLVLEACEYKRQFIKRAPKPYVSVVTHIDIDHTDFFKSQKEYNQAFVDFLAPTTNFIVMDNKGINEKKVRLDIENKNIIDVNKYRKLVKFRNEHLIGEFNFENVLRAYATAINLGFDGNLIKQAVNSFPGISCRFEYVGKTTKGALVYKDYAHNPAKIKACLEGAHKVHPDKRIILVFQPHSVERSYSFRKEFAQAVMGADELLVSNIFSPVRESADDKALITDQEFVQILQKANPGKKVIYIGEVLQSADLLNNSYGSEDVLVLASAGDLYKVIPRIVQK